MAHRQRQTKVGGRYMRSAEAPAIGASPERAAQLLALVKQSAKATYQRETLLFRIKESLLTRFR